LQVEIYNVLGQKLATLLNEQKQAGNHSIRWNRRNANGEKVGAGIYLCRMQANSHVETIKMTLLP
jgi:flagellar hook assembly protein FlgD